MTNKVYTRTPERAISLPPQMQQLGLDFEPRQLYQPGKYGGRFALCSKIGVGRVTQELFDVANLDWAVRQVERLPERHKRHFWISQATLAPWAANRRISSIVLLNAVWVDIDIAHPPKGFDGLMPTGTPEQMAALLALQIQDAGLPEPSYIVATGGGLCVKYLFDKALPSAARARWQSMQRYLVSRVGELGDLGQRWPVDYQACDAARILRLVGSHNPRWDQPCRIVWGNDKRYEVDLLADFILPYTRDQLREFAAKRALYKGWDENRASAVAQGIQRRVVIAADRKSNDPSEQMNDELARSLWTARFEFGRALLEHRGGAYEGSRNNWFWPLANAIAYSCTKEDQLTKELAGLHQAFFKHDGWTQAEAMQTAASVARRVKTGELYKMKTSTFLEKLEVSATELDAFGGLLGASRHNRNRDNWNVGSMGFEPMKGLKLEEFVAETRRRQAAAGAQIGSGNLIASAKAKALSNADKRAKAVLMRNSGLSNKAIARELRIHPSTVANWFAGGV